MWPPGYGISSYAANAFVFGSIQNTGGYPPNVVVNTGGYGIPWFAAVAFNTFATVTDGLSNTIFWTEKYGSCNGGGSLWANGCTCDQFAPVIGFGVNGLANYFQIQPNPFESSACNPYLAQSGHTAGIHACLGDGSVRFCSQGMSATTWFLALVPNDGNPLPSDW